MELKNTLVVGAGGVGGAVVHKCAQHNDVLGQASLADCIVEFVSP